MCQKHQKSKNKEEKITEKVLAFVAFIMREHYTSEDG